MPQFIADTDNKKLSFWPFSIPAKKDIFYLFS